MKAKSLVVLVTIIIVVILFFLGKSMTAKMYCQHEIDDMRKWDNETSKWFSLEDLSPKEAQYKYNLCLHRFGE